mmetsp:Transcript_6305/g.13890  ORF Transcript_6305/g.13890 Transcript_6305/m.13890 type:complete len:81 (+) Transcript_6305:2066-2308(+)
MQRQHPHCTAAHCTASSADKCRAAGSVSLSSDMLCCPGNQQQPDGQSTPLCINDPVDEWDMMLGGSGKEAGYRGYSMCWC